MKLEVNQRCWYTAVVIVIVTTYSPLNDAASTSNYMAMKDMVVSNLQRKQRKWSQLILRYYLGHLPGLTEGNHDKQSGKSVSCSIFTLSTS